MAQFTFTCEHLRASDYKGKETDAPRVALQKIANFINGLSAGSYQGTSFEVSQDSATGTVTLSGVDGAAATGSYALSDVGGDLAEALVTYSSASGTTTATVNGVAFAQTTGSDTERTAELVSQVNASVNPLVAGLITAIDNENDTASLVAVAKGTAGNAYTLVVSGTGISRSGATFTGGANGAVTVAINGTSVGPVDTTDLSDEDAATAVAAAIEANGTLAPLLAAVADSTDVDITWGTKGTVGNAVTLAAGVSTTGTATRSGATLAGGADNDVTVTVGGVAVVSDTTTLSNSAAATLVAADINADAGASELVTASASSNVVTLTAKAAGDEGNGITLTAATDAGTAEASGATLSGGSAFSYNL